MIWCQNCATEFGFGPCWSCAEQACTFRSYKVEEWHNIPGRGNIAVVRADRDESNEEMVDALRGQGVFLDEKLYFCKGVEYFLGYKINKGQHLGIMIRGER